MIFQMVIFHSYAKPKGILIFPRISHDIPPKKNALLHGYIPGKKPMIAPLR